MQIKFVFIFYNLQFPLEGNKAAPFSFRETTLESTKIEDTLEL